MPMLIQHCYKFLKTMILPTARTHARSSGDTHMDLLMKPLDVQRASQGLRRYLRSRMNPEKYLTKVHVHITPGSNLRYQKGRKIEYCKSFVEFIYIYLTTLQKIRSYYHNMAFKENKLI